MQPQPIADRWPKRAPDTRPVDTPRRLHAAKAVASGCEIVQNALRFSQM
jgi:hypothetical protein